MTELLEGGGRPVEPAGGAAPGGPPSSPPVSSWPGRPVGATRSRGAALPGWAAPAVRVAGDAGRRLAAAADRAVQAAQDLDERVRHDPLRRERSAMVVIGAVAGLVVLGIVVLLIVVGGGRHEAARRASSTRPAGTQPAASANAATTPTAVPSASGGTGTATAAPTDSTTPTTPAGGVLQAQNSGKCLAVPQDTLQEGVQLVQRACDGDPGERFHLVPAAGQPTTFSLVDALTSRCVDVQGGAVDDGTPVIQWECNGQANQQFQLRDVQAPGQVQIVALHSGKCVEVDQSTADGAPVRQATCQSADVAAAQRNQSWQLIG